MPGTHSETEHWGTVHRVMVAAVADALGLPFVPPKPAGAADWPVFLDAVRRHGVAPLVRRSNWFTADGAPAEVHEKLHGLARRSTARALRSVAVLDEVLSVFGAAGIDVVVLKGLPMAAWAYGDPMARQTGNLDVLVDPTRFAEAARALIGAGFEVMPLPFSFDSTPAEFEALTRRPLQSEISFTGHGIFVDLHWRLFTNPHLLTLDPFAPSSRRAVEVGGLDVPTLAAEPTWWYAAAHGARHRWSRLKWLADVPAVVATCPGLLTAEAHDRAAAAGADRCVAGALLLSESVFGPYLGEGSRRPAVAVVGTECLVRSGLSGLRGEGRDGSMPSIADLTTAARCALALRDDPVYRREELRQATLRTGRSLLGPDARATYVAAAPLAMVARMVGPTARTAEAAAELMRARLSVRLARPTLAALGIRPGPPAPDIDLTAETGRGAAQDAMTADEHEAAAAAVGDAIADASRWLPGRTTRLCRALAARRMLDRRSVACVLELGDGDVATDDEAAVYVGRRSVVGGSEAQDRRRTAERQWPPLLPRRGL